MFSAIKDKAQDVLGAASQAYSDSPYGQDPYGAQTTENIANLARAASPGSSRGAAFGRAFDEYAIPSPILQQPRTDRLAGSTVATTR